MHKKIEYRLAFFPHCVTHEKDFKIQSIFACRLVGVYVYEWRKRKNNKELYNLNLFEKERSLVKGGNKIFQHLKLY